MNTASCLRHGLGDTRIVFPKSRRYFQVVSNQWSHGGTGTRCSSATISHGGVPRNQRPPVLAVPMPRSPSHTRQVSSASSVRSEKPPLAEARPSSSIILLSPSNQVLLLHRVQTSSSFPSAHVFPGGNLSSFHEPPIPPPDSQERHHDSLAYRLAAVRETFEESGILIAKRSLEDDVLLVVPEAERENARRDIHGDRVKFTEWVEGGLGGTLCVDDLVPFTRWITPPNMPKRFTTQMYVYFMPLADSPRTTGSDGRAVDVDVVQTPTPDGGVEHTAATFADATDWLRRQSSGEIVLFPPQCYLLTLVAQIFDSVSLESVGHDLEARYAAQRRALVDFVRRTPTSSEGGPGGKGPHPSAMIPWSEKVMSPHTLFMRESDDRVVLGIDKPGPELKGSGAGGDFERVVLVKFAKGGPKDVEVRRREEVLREEKAVKESAKEGGRL